jgi:CubicO group peptidase (beta-lactamase class C family)
MATEQEDEALYLRRFEQLAAAARAGSGLESYDPLEAVPGAARVVPLPRAGANRTGIAAAALQAADDYAARNNSIALLVFRAGKLELERYYRGHQPAQTFPSRSLAKPMTAVAIGRAIALGKIRSLDQPVADFVREWQGDPRRSRILVRHLLDMRSGFLPQAAATRADDILNRAYLHPRHEAIILRDYPVVDEPGTRFEYNNATAEMVAVLIERATGRRYAEFLSTEVLKPLGGAFGVLPDAAGGKLAQAGHAGDAGWALAGQATAAGRLRGSDAARDRGEPLLRAGPLCRGDLYRPTRICESGARTAGAAGLALGTLSGARPGVVRW